MTTRPLHIALQYITVHSHDHTHIHAHSEHVTVGPLNNRHTLSIMSFISRLIYTLSEQVSFIERCPLFRVSIHPLIRESFNQSVNLSFIEKYPFFQSALASLSLLIDQCLASCVLPA